MAQVTSPQLPFSYSTIIVQGAQWYRVFTYDQNSLPVNLTGYTAALTFSINNVTQPFLIATTSNGKIVLGGALGTITITLGQADTAKLPGPTTAQPTINHSMLLTDGSGNQIPLWYGTCTVIVQA